MKIADIIMVVLALAVGITSMCFLGSTPGSPSLSVVELTQEDVFAHKGITGDQMSLRGLRLGDSYERAIEIFGVPDNQPSYDNGSIVNLEYSKRLGYDGIVLILNVQDKMVNRITMYKPMDELFFGKTKFTDEKRGVYDTYGVPAQQILTHKNIWVYSYPDRGFDVLLYEKTEIGLSIYPPVQESKA